MSPTLDPRIADAPEPADGLSPQGRAQRVSMDLARAIGILSDPGSLSDDWRKAALAWCESAAESVAPLAYPRLHAIEGGKR